ncbi:MAG: helix-turn-helix domain-containing protein, partial [Burkholderiaceae bacterium]|nr:helix-turn-helix domain-containing protein [Burkholderiaceae bacterium]
QESDMPMPALSPSVVAQLLQHPLGGNVRELENLLHRAVALSEGDELQIDFAPTQAQTPEASGPQSAPGMPGNLQSYLDRQEREILIKALQECGFNRTAAATRLGLSLRQIRYRIARLNIAMPNGDTGPNEEP